MKVLCNVYKSLTRSDYYLFVNRDDELTRVPESLLKHFGPHELAMTLALSAEQRLAAATAADVLDALVDKGYYLQLPPQRNDADMQAVRSKNEKL